MHCKELIVSDELSSDLLQKPRDGLASCKRIVLTKPNISRVVYRILHLGLYNSGWVFIVLGVLFLLKCHKNYKLN
jgi:hypothetical protein